MYAGIKIMLLFTCISTHVIYVGAVYSHEEDNAYIPKDVLETLQNAFDKGGATAAKALLSDKLDEWKESQINVGIVGNSGVGKSSFINAIRGLTADDDGAAAVGVAETTMEPTPYNHPNNEKMLLWDLPGVGTPTFTQTEYLDRIESKIYDYFIIISSSRFTENDIWLAKELKSKNKKFYFVRSKIAMDIQNNMKSHPKTHNKNKVLNTVREDCKKNLKKYTHDVYLIDNYETDKYDFELLSYKLVIDAPALKREAMLFTLNSFSEHLISFKKEALVERIHSIALVSALVGAIPIPVLDVAVDVAVLVEEGNFYKQQFGLSDQDLANFAFKVGKSVDELTESLGIESKLMQFTAKGIAAYMSKLGAKKVANFTSKKILKYVLPGIGSLVSSAASYTGCYYTLESILDMIVQDALKIARSVHDND